MFEKGPWPHYLADLACFGYVAVADCATFAMWHWRGVPHNIKFYKIFLKFWKIVFKIKKYENKFKKQYKNFENKFKNI